MECRTASRLLEDGSPRQPEYWNQDNLTKKRRQWEVERLSLSMLNFGPRVCCDSMSATALLDDKLDMGLQSTMTIQPSLWVLTWLWV